MPAQSASCVLAGVSLPVFQSPTNATAFLTIVKSVIDLCQNLNLTCVVEGMETDAQARVLRELGCTIMQGWLFGKPMPASEVLAFLEVGRPPRLTALAS